MYQLYKSISNRELLRESHRMGAQQIPIMMLSFIVAELFYKFHSFTLESVAFLATWFVVDWVMSQVRRRIDRTVTE